MLNPATIVLAILFVICLAAFLFGVFQHLLAFRAMPIPAGIVGRPLVSAIRTFIHMTAQSGGSALTYCMKCFPLLDRHRVAVCICISIL